MRGLTIFSYIKKRLENSNLKRFVLSYIFIFLAINFYGQYHVLYEGNGNNGGVVPIDNNTYSSNDMVMVSWEGTLSKTGYDFTCWNTQTDGSGINYSPDAFSSGATLQINSENVTLYAQWGNCEQLTTNKALSFNEGQFLSNDDNFENVVIENMPIFTNAITIEGWLNPSDYDSVEAHNEPVILKFYTEDVYIGIKYIDGKHVLSWNGWTAYGTTNIPANEWTHFAIVVSNSTIEAMYINGLPELFTLDGSVNLPTSDEWVIGNMTWSASPYRWHGMIDEMRIWDDIRSPSEILSYYDAPLQGNESGLFAYYNFDKSSTTQMLCDKNLNGETHYGILRNMEETDWVNGVPFQNQNLFVTIATDGTGDYNCNGINDEIQINQAINFIANLGGGTVHLKNGEYIIDNPIIIKSNIIFEGESDENTIIKLADEANWGKQPNIDYPIYHDAESFIIGYGNSNNNQYWDFTIGRLENVTLQNFKIDGNKSNQHYVNLDGLTVLIEGGTSNYIAIDFGDAYDSNLSSNLNFSHINVVNNLGDAISVNHADNITIEYCKSANIGHSSVYLIEVSNVLVQFNEYDVYANSGIRIDIGNHIIIRDNHLYNTTNNGNFGIQISHRYTTNIMNDVLIERNLIEDIPYAGIALYTDDPTITNGVLIRNNLIYRCGLPSVANESGGINIFNFNNTIIENNTIFNNCAGGIVFGINPYYPNGLTGNKTTIIRNNIITSSIGLEIDAYGIYIQDNDLTTLILENNNVWNNKTGDYYNCVAGNGSLSNDPLFIDGQAIDNKWDTPYPELDLQLQATSICIDSGVFVDMLTSDYEGNLRPQGLGFDIGCYEYASSLTVAGQDNIVINVFPNPVKNEIKIESNFDRFSYKIFDLNGNLLKKDVLIRKTIYVNDLPYGVYLLIIENDRIKKHIKFIKS